MSDSEEDAVVERQVKISLVGEPSTGKSLLCSRYLGFHMNGPAAPTQGAEVLLGECPVKPSKPPVPIKFCDVSGNSCHTTMLANYLFLSDIIIFVYDVTNLQSFERLSVWLQNVIKIFCDTETQPLFALFGNKCDLEHQRAVRLSNIQAFTDENNLINFIGSARTGENVNPTIISLVSETLGIPINRSLFSNAVIKAELSYIKPQHRANKSKPVNNNNNGEVVNKNKKINHKDNESKETRNVQKSHKKALKNMKIKASSSAVCSVQ